MNTDKLTLLVYCNFLVLLSTPLCSQNINKQIVNIADKNLTDYSQGIGIKGREMALVWHEKASRTALQTSSILHTHTLLVQTHNMITVKEIAEQFVVNNN